MRRWDGFVARDDGNASAERLVRINRLKELDALLSPAQSKVTTAETAVSDRQTEISSIETSLAEAREARRTAEDDLRKALREADQAEEALNWLQKRTASLSEREYRDTLAREGLTQIEFCPQDPTCHLHSILLASRS